jgi:hypothetical protein
MPSPIRHCVAAGMWLNTTTHHLKPFRHVSLVYFFPLKTERDPLRQHFFANMIRNHKKLASPVTQVYLCFLDQLLREPVNQDFYF